MCTHVGGWTLGAGTLPLPTKKDSLEEREDVVIAILDSINTLSTTQSFSKLVDSLVERKEDKT